MLQAQPVCTLTAESSLDSTQPGGTEPVIDPVMEERGKHEEYILCLHMWKCVCVHRLYLLLLHNLVSCLEDWCIHHLDAFSHFLHFVQKLCVIPAVSGKDVMTYSYPSHVVHIDSERGQCTEEHVKSTGRLMYRELIDCHFINHKIILEMK